ncbi:isocitrate lyase/PEP mutase family protein [Pseudonocardia spinosispora]|uniref:isocitrate lyase/PEP mutase family protein n=1 Tax=Pseudonocardia spinosispora TaxID=103441 RepID=UPI00041C0A82|nr:isocitrate lyase/phosphoenolpyruvate mutase family protein [Pseudonocardia spinosispora]
MSTLTERAERLRALHQPGKPLVLANAWDPVTAAAVVDAGFEVVATTSHAVAATLGHADGGHTPPEEMFAAISRIAAVAGDLPVTADIEAGYGLDPKDIVAELLAAGAVGCNLEDSDAAVRKVVDVEQQADRLAAVRAAADAAGVPIVINARVDVMLPGYGPSDDPAELLADAIARGRRYREAGADCVFPIPISDPATIRALVEGIGGAVNMMMFPGVPSVAELADLGVARVSYGALLHHELMTAHRARLTEIAPRRP